MVFGPIHNNEHPQIYYSANFKNIFPQNIQTPPKFTWKCTLTCKYFNYEFVRFCQQDQLLMKDGALHPKNDVESLYLPQGKDGSGVIGCETYIKSEECRMLSFHLWSK